MESQSPPEGWSRLWIDGASAYSPRSAVPAECGATSARAANQSWYRVNALADVAEVYVYDEIGFFGVTAKDFVQELSGLRQSQLDIHLNTPGGDVFDGIAIYTALKNHPGQVNVYVDSLAASIGSVIAMAGDRIIMAKHARLMMHEAWALTIGNAADMAKMAERLSSTSDIIASIYAERAGGTQAEWRAKMAEESWFTDQQAVDAGLADEVGVQAKKQAAFANSTSFRPGLIAARLIEANQADTGMSTVAAVLGSQVYDALTDQAQDWLEDQTLTMDQFLALSGLITDTVAALNSALGGIGLAELEVPGCDEGDAFVQYTETTWARLRTAFSNAGRTMSQANLNKMHDSMQQISDVHAAVCDMGADCPIAPSEAEHVEVSLPVVIEAHAISPERQKTLAEIDARMASKA